VVECNYRCDVHQGPVEWHHPVGARPEIGLFLCQLHHSLIQGRKKRHGIETLVNKTLDEMRADVMALEAQLVREQGGKLDEIDKR